MDELTPEQADDLSKLANELNEADEAFCDLAYEFVVEHPDRVSPELLAALERVNAVRAQLETVLGKEHPLTK